MLINKITIGFVIQTFDTEKGKYVSQEFIAGDSVSYEHKETGDPADPSLIHVGGQAADLPFDMKQPATVNRSDE